MLPARLLATLRTCITVIFWYCISSAIILTTKWLFNNYFRFPLTVTTFSNTLTTIWAFLFSRRPIWRPQPLTRKQFREYVLPIGIATALEIGFSNIALNILSVSFGTILKGVAPVFTMFWGILMGLELFSPSLCLALVTISFGVALASFGQGHSFAFNGFILQILATASGGLRWAMTQALLKGKDHTVMPPLTATLYTSPATAACVFPFALALEGRHVFDKLIDLDWNELVIIFCILFAIASLVFILLISEYWLVNRTSSLAVSVAGVFKELLTIAGGIIFFKETMNALNIIGFAICHLGISAYAWLRIDIKSSQTQPHNSILPTSNISPSSPTHPDSPQHDLHPDKVRLLSDDIQDDPIDSQLEIVQSQPSISVSVAP